MRRTETDRCRPDRAAPDPVGAQSERLMQGKTTGIRTGRFLYTEWLVEPGDDNPGAPVKLYDVLKDPEQYDNLADDKEYADAVARASSRRPGQGPAVVGRSPGAAARRPAVMSAGGPRRRDWGVGGGHLVVAWNVRHAPRPVYLEPRAPGLVHSRCSDPRRPPLPHSGPSRCSSAGNPSRAATEHLRHHPFSVERRSRRISARTAGTSG